MQVIMVIVFDAEILPKAVWSGGVQLMATQCDLDVGAQGNTQKYADVK